jgi:L,D-transpeptidase YcbB
MTMAMLLAASAATAAPDVKSSVQLVDLPAAGRAGIDMIYIDRETANVEPEPDELLAEIFSSAETKTDLFRSVNHLFTDLRRGSVRYRQKWGSLPQIDIPAGPAIRAGQDGKRVEMLRQRLGLKPGTRFDNDLAAAVRAYQQVHGLEVSGVADAATVASLNLGFAHYERLIALNLERSRTLPATTQHRYVLVDAGSAQLWMYEGGRPVDTMRTIVGTREQQTPKIAALVRYAEVNPYWNIPPDLVEERIAPRVLSEGISYLNDRGYEVLSDWSDEAVVTDPRKVDWAALAAGTLQLPVRQKPGEGNFMGEIKFMMPNDFGIYLHDTPTKGLFQQADRWISSGCVRVEDARRLARWLFGEMPRGRSRTIEERVDLVNPVAVYITYLTAEAVSGSDGIRFRPDRYGRDPEALAQMFPSASIETASRH